MDIKGAMTAEICRETGATPQTPAAKATACAPVRRLTVTPGPSQVADTLPAPLQIDPVELLTYRIQIFNSTGHSAGNSIGAYAAAGTAPPPIASLRATASERGAILEWSRIPPLKGTGAYFVDLKRIDISPAHTGKPAAKKSSSPPRSTGKNQPAKASKPRDDSPNEVHLRDPDPDNQSAAHGETAGTVDTTATMGDTYTYVAERVGPVTIGDHHLEIHSEPSSPVTLAMTDTFPPKTPTGLATISGSTKSEAGSSGTVTEPAPYIDLSWEPNEETDLAGYRVYRQLATPDGSPQGPLARLTAVPLDAPAYRDMAVKPGQGYSYTVTAVDAAGNESAPSAKVLETVP